jgi:sulfite exporter TauE/SafE
MNPPELAAGPLNYWLAFTMGLLASGHCIGMCGALASSVFIRLGEQARRPLPYLAYQLARVGMYTLVGFTAASLGHVLVSMGIIGAAQGLLQLVVGLFVVVIGLDIAGLSPWRVRGFGLSFAFLGRWLQAAGRKGPVVGALLGGMLNGLVPCPLTFAVAIKATTAPSPLEGGLLMLAFGLGTVPSMLFVSVAFGLLGQRARGLLLRGAAAVVVVMGLGTFIQGLTYFNIMRGLVY